ncbi:MAG: methyltransferase domain-containing protein [Actinomycetota bacterium]|nr:methyltransferase domain-containing protein [Actinomycetota bacterium]
MAEVATEVCEAFVVSAEGYDRLMGRFLPSLGPAFADAAGITAGQRVLDVGCGPGGLTGELVRRVGAGAVAAIDPSPPFVEACRARHAGVDVRIGVAERPPFADAEFDAALACLVVGFMSDAHAGALEMARVTRPGGTVAACFWDAAHMPAIQLFWKAAAEVDPSRVGEVARLGSKEGDLAALLANSGLRDVYETVLLARAEYQDFADWWSPIAQGIGPAGAHYRSLDGERRRAVRAACEQEIGNPDTRFVLEARAWCARGTR